MHQIRPHELLEETLQHISVWGALGKVYWALSSFLIRYQSCLCFPVALPSEIQKTHGVFLYHSLVVKNPGGASGKEPVCPGRRSKRCSFDPWVGKIPWRRAWQPIPEFLHGESQGQRSLVGYGSLGRKQSDKTEVT